MGRKCKSCGRLTRRWSAAELATLRRRWLELAGRGATGRYETAAVVARELRRTRASVASHLMRREPDIWALVPAGESRPEAGGTCRGWHVVGERQGGSLILATFPTEKAALAEAALLRRHLEGYSRVVVERHRAKGRAG